MVKVFVAVDGETKFAEISDETHLWLHDGSALRMKPMHDILRRVVSEYGALTEENILKFMDEKWIM